MRARQARTAVTMVALCGILVLGLAVGLKALFAPTDSQAGTPTASPSPKCRAQKLGPFVHSRQVEVSVFNAGTRQGLAGTVMARLSARGFQAGDVGNAPAGANVRVVEVWTGTSHDLGARLVARQFGRGVTVQVSSQDLGPGVDVLVGNGYHGLAHAPRKLEVTGPGTVCKPSPAAG